MLQKATLHDIPTIYPLIDVIWQEMDFPLRHLLDPTAFQATMLELMQDPAAKFSYQNCWVYRNEQTIQGIVYGYYGKDENRFDEHFYAFIERKFPHLSIRNDPFERESNDNEWYIDSIVVDPDQRGKGIGSAMLRALPSLIQPSVPFGLNCDQQNPKAKALYIQHGFQTVATVSFLGHTYDHMQRTAF